MMDRILNQDKRFTDRTSSIFRSGIERRSVGGSRAPGIPFAIDDGKTRVRDAEAAVLVDCGDVGRCADVECVVAD